MRAWTSPELFGASTLCLSEASGSLRPSIELFSFSKRASILSICAFIECCTESEFIEGLTLGHARLRNSREVCHPERAWPQPSPAAGRPANAEFVCASDPPSLG